MEKMRGGERRDERFPRRLRLGENRNYRYVYRRGKSWPSRSLVLVYLKGRDLKIGFSVSGKVGNAVTRNRVRRWLREDARKLRTRLKRGKYIVVARPGAAEAKHRELTRELQRLIERAKLMKDEPLGAPQAQKPEDRASNGPVHPGGELSCEG